MHKCNGHCAGCSDCAETPSAEERFDCRLTLVGNANVGKTSVYNAITHSDDHVGNWHGVTVTAAQKAILYRHKRVLVTDLPGIYSMSVDGGEELVSRKAILARDYDCIVYLCEVNNLPRNFYLLLQLLELHLPVIVGINMVDELKRLGRSVNYRLLEERLGVPVIPVSAKYHSDIHLLTDVALEGGAKTGNPQTLHYLDALPLEQIRAIVSPNAKAAGYTDEELGWLAIKVMDADRPVLDKLALSEQQTAALARFGDMQCAIAAARYDKIDALMDGAVSESTFVEDREMHEHMAHAVPVETGDDASVSPATDKAARRHKRLHDRYAAGREAQAHGYSRADKILLNRFLAIPIFLLIMCAVFLLTFGLIGNFLTKGIDYALAHWVAEPLETWLHGLHSPEWVVRLLVDGVVGGVGGVLAFIPQIILLFLFLSLLEDSGYMSRVAFMTDGLFRKLGLSGKSSFTLLMGFGCSASAVMTARNLDDPAVKRKTVLLTPFMSCSARLPVYATLGAYFFGGGNAIVIFLLYLIGIAVALVWAKILNTSKRMRSDNADFIMEMPPYRFPTARRVLRLAWSNVKSFLIRVGTLIFAVNVIVWVLSNFSFTQGFVDTASDQSIMAQIAGVLGVLFVPLGWGGWRQVTALLSGLVAKEIVLATVETLGGAQIFANGVAAFSFLVFVLLYVPCVATVGAVAREEGWKIALLGIAMQLGTAYVVSLVCFWVGTALSYLSAGAIAAIVCGAVVGIVLACVTVGAVRRRRLQTVRK